MFTEVGGMLSEIRKKDFRQDFGPSEACRALTNESDDPATFSSSLKEKLKSNKVIGDKNMKQEFQKVYLIVKSNSLTIFFWIYSFSNLAVYIL